MKVFKGQSLEQRTKNGKGVCTWQQGQTNCSVCVSAEALGAIRNVPIKQLTDIENVCAKILSIGNGLKLSGMGSQKH